MKKFLISAALLAAAVPGIASATTAPGPVSGTVTVNGTVAARCQFTTGTATITIPELSDPATGNLLTSTVNGQSANLVGWCNGTTSTMTVNASPILNAGTAPTGFTNRVDYTATATAHPATGPVSATDGSADSPTAGTAATVGVFTSQIEVGLSAASSPAGKLLAGAYTGQVLVTLTPGL